MKKYVCQLLVTLIYLLLRYDVNPWGFKTEVENIIVLFWLTNLYREVGAKYEYNQSSINNNTIASERAKMHIRTAI